MGFEVKYLHLKLQEAKCSQNYQSNRLKKIQQEIHHKPKKKNKYNILKGKTNINTKSNKKFSTNPTKIQQEKQKEMIEGEDQHKHKIQ